MDDLNCQLRGWLDDLAMSRTVPPHRDRVVREAFEQERPSLTPLPPQEARFDTDLARPIASGKTPYVRFDANEYSIPPGLIYKPLTLSASERVVRIFDGPVQFARHDRSYDRGQRVEDAEHLRALAAKKDRSREIPERDRQRPPGVVACAGWVRVRGSLLGNTGGALLVGRMMALWVRIASAGAGWSRLDRCMGGMMHPSSAHGFAGEVRL